MQLPFFYEPTLTNNASLFTLSADSFKHSVLVLRMKVNDAMHLTNGMGLLCRAILVSADKKHAIVQIQSFQFFPKNEIVASIGISLLKNATRLEWFLEKATELGIHNIYLLQCSRTEKQHFRFDRLNGIIVAAMLQSQQTWLPILHEPQTVDNLINQEPYNNKFIAHCEVANKLYLQQIAIKESTLVLIGK
ncbi:MAG: RsmE family RNA methyltransferase [Chitinophagaceae bacterium]